MYEKRKSHAVYNLTYHIILVSKYRRPVFTGEVAERLKQECIRLISEMGGEVQEIETETDHVHILTDLSPDRSISETINTLKGVTSRILRRDYWNDISRYLWGSSLWSDSYYVAAAGEVTIDRLKVYVLSQPTEEHQKRKYEKTGRYKNAKRKKHSDSSST